MPKSDNGSPKIRRWQSIALASGFAIIALRAILPLALEWAIPWLAAREAGARVEVGNIDLGLIAGEIDIEQLRLAAPTDVASEAPIDLEQALVRLGAMNVEFEWLPLFRGRVHVRLIRLDDLRVRVAQRTDGSFVLPTPPESPADESAAEPALPPEQSDHATTHAPEAPVEKTPSGKTDREADEMTAPQSGNDWEFALDRLELNAPDLALHNLAMDAEVASFKADQFAIDGLLLGPEGIGLDDISLEQPDLDIDRDWLLALGSGTAADGDSSPAADTAPPSLRLRHLALNSGGFQIRTPQGPIEAAIRLEVTDAGTAPGHVFPLDLELRLGEGQISLAGQLGLFPLFYRGQFRWNALRVPPFLLISNPEIVPWLASCNASGDFDVVFRSVDGEEPAGLTTSGTASVTDLSFKDPETGELALEWDRIELELREGNYPLEPSSPRRFDISNISLQAPQIVFTNPPDSLDRLLRLLAGVDSADPAADSEPAAGTEGVEVTANEDVATPDDPDSTEAPSNAPIIAVEALEITDGQLLFVDRSVSPTHETRIQDLRVEASGLTTEPVAANRINIRGRIQQSGTFALEGALPDGGGSLRFTLRGLDLVSYDAFARDAGWRVRGGKTSLDSRIRLKGERYQTQNELSLHDLRLDSTSPGAFTSTFGISLDMALALLRDRAGDIALSVPLAFDTEGLDIGLGAVVRSAMKAAIVGALSSPFQLVGALLPEGGGPATLEAIPMTAGSAELAPEALERIEPLGVLLLDRPRLRLTLRGQSAPADRAPLALAILEESALSGDSFPETEGDSFFARRRVGAALQDRSKGSEAALDPDDEALLERYVAAQQVPVERALQLAQARAEAVRDTLTAAGVPLEALRLEPPAEAETPGIAIDFELQTAPEEGGT